MLPAVLDAATTNNKIMNSFIFKKIPIFFATCIYEMTRQISAIS